LKPRFLLAIWLDGFRTDYLSKKKTPFIYKLSQRSLTGEYQPCLAFAGIGASVVTGLSQQKHGIWTEFRYDPKKSPFKWTGKALVINRFIDAIADQTGCAGQLVRAAINLSVFKTSNRFSGKTYTPMALKIPLHSLHSFDTTTSHKMLSRKEAFITPSLFDLLREREIPFKALEESKMKDTRIFGEAIHVDKKARLVFIQLAELDTVGHAKGPRSKEIHRSLRKVDSMVRRIIEEHRKSFDTDVFIFSDHGMVEVKKVVNILGQLRRSDLKEGRDFVVFLDSTLARFWTQKNGCKRRISEALDKVQGGRTLSEDDLKRYQAPNDRKYGDIIWLADPGTLILPNYYQGTKLVKGMHGYAPGTRELGSPVIIYGEDIPSGRVQRTATPMDILPTILDLMNLDTPAYVEGKSLLNSMNSTSS